MSGLSWVTLAALILALGCGGTVSGMLGCSGCGGGGGGTPSGSAGVSVGTYFFSSDHNRSMNDAVDTVVVGGTVTWTWTNTGTHNIQSVGTPSFPSGPVATASGNTYQVTFTTPGTYRYDCVVHGNLMTGVVVVMATGTGGHY